MPRVGVDLGGTKIALVAIDETGRRILSQRRPTPAGNYQATLDAVCQMVFEADRRLGTCAPVGICTPGSISPLSGRVRNANSTCLNGQTLHTDLSRVLAREVRVANDADCFAVSEATDGAGASTDSVFGVILGTGVGGGLVIHGRLLSGTNGIAGEWGHNPLPSPTTDDLPLPTCYCGRRGCIETYLSGPAMAAEHLRLTGLEMSARQIAAEAAGGHSQHSKVTLMRYELRLARALAGVINILDPDVIVLGGGLSHIEQLYTNVPKLWRPFIFSDVVNTRLVPNRHGDDSGVRGAAWLWPA